MILLAGDPELINLRSLLTQMSKGTGHKMQSLHSPTPALLEP